MLWKSHKHHSDACWESWIRKNPHYTLHGIIAPLSFHKNYRRILKQYHLIFNSPEYIWVKLRNLSRRRLELLEGWQGGVGWLKALKRLIEAHLPSLWVLCAVTLMFLRGHHSSPGIWGYARLLEAEMSVSKRAGWNRIPVKNYWSTCSCEAQPLSGSGK